jgi:hypothetical protein
MPRRDILLDSAGNRVIVNGDYAFAEDQQAVKQGIECEVSLIRGEYWLDTSRGVRWLDVILVRAPKPILVKSELSSAIARVADVTSVSSAGYSVDPATRKGSATFNATTSAGDVDGSVAAPGAV